MKSFFIAILCVWIGGFLFGDLYGRNKSKNKIAMLENNLKACEGIKAEK